jgi:hypothetical protein
VLAVTRSASTGVNEPHCAAVGVDDKQGTAIRTRFAGHRPRTIRVGSRNPGRAPLARLAPRAWLDLLLELDGGAKLLRTPTQSLVILVLEHLGHCNREDVELAMQRPITATLRVRQQRDQEKGDD